MEAMMGPVDDLVSHTRSYETYTDDWTRLSRSF